MIFYLILVNNSYCQKTLKLSSKPTIFIFAHGIFDASCQAEQYKSVLPNNAMIISFDFNDAMRIPWIYRPFLSSLAQENEIEQLNSVYESLVAFFQDQKYPIPNIILIGMSRGASVILNFLARKNPEHVAAAICESPFDSMQHVAAHACLYFQKAYKNFALIYFFPYFFIIIQKELRHYIVYTRLIKKFQFF